MVKNYLQGISITKRTLASFLLAGFIPLLILMVGGYVSVKNILTQEAIAHLSTIADQKERAFEEFSSAKRHEIESLSHTPSLIEAVSNYADTFAKNGVGSDAYKNVDKKYRELFTRYLISFNYYDFFLISSNGDIVFSVALEDDFGTNLNTGKYSQTGLGKAYRNALNFLRSDITQPEFYDPSNEMAAFLSAPIFENGILKGIVAFQIRQAGIYDIVQNYSGLGSTGETVLGVKKASVILIASPLRNNPESAFKKTIPLQKGIRQPMWLAHEGGTGSEIITNANGVKVLNVWRYLPSLRLGMVVRMNTAEAFSKIQDVNKIGIILLIISTGLILLVSVLFARTLMHPIQELTVAAKAVGEGDYSKIVEIHGGHEFKALAHTFNAMVEQIVKVETELLRSQSFLEVQVAERTKDLESALQAAEEFNTLQKQFVSMASHEFRTPLSIIDMTAQRLSKRHSHMSGQQLREHFVKIRNAVNRITGLIESTLNAEKIEVGKLEFFPNLCDLKMVLKDCISDQMDVSRKYLINADLNEIPEHVYADQGHLVQIFTNLLSNAVKYSPNNKLILVIGQCDDNFAYVSVVDHGIGVPEKEMSKMFNRFFRTSSAAGIPGTGIGLNLAKNLTEIQGGTITLESLDGEGSTFTVSIPIHEPMHTRRGNFLEGEGYYRKGHPDQLAEDIPL